MQFIGVGLILLVVLILFPPLVLFFSIVAIKMGEPLGCGLFVISLVACCLWWQAIQHIVWAVGG